jgi:hypothetical protein
MKFVPEQHQLYPRDVKRKWAKEGRFALAFAKKGYPKMRQHMEFRTKADAILYYYCALSRRIETMEENVAFGPNRARQYAWHKSSRLITDIHAGDYEDRPHQFHLDIAADNRHLFRVGFFQRADKSWVAQTVWQSYLNDNQDNVFLREAIDGNIQEATMYWSKRKLLQGLVSSRVCVLRRARRHRLFDRNVFIHVLSVYLQHPKLNVPY